MQKTTLCSIFAAVTILSFTYPIHTYAAATDGAERQIVWNGQQIATSYGFSEDGTEYMSLLELSSSLNQAGIQNTLIGNDWYFGANVPANQQSATTSQSSGTQVRVMTDGNYQYTVNGINDSNEVYFPIWYLMKTLQTLGDYTAWRNGTFMIANAPIPYPVVNPYQTYTYQQMALDIQKLTEMYPDLIHSEVVGQTAYGRNIYAVSVGKGSTTVFMNGSHHAREWITTNLTMYMIDMYAQAYHAGMDMGGYDVRDVLNQTTIWFMPMVNPDGVTLQQLGLSQFPKSTWSSLMSWNGGSANFTHWKANAEGIDLNRQYPAGWSHISLDPVTHPWYKDYKGKAPTSTNEAKAVVNFIKQINPEAEISYHASGNVIYWGWNLSGNECSTFHQYAQEISNLTGGYRIESLQASGGGLTDWWTHDLHKPGFTVEVGPPEGENQVPIQYFKTIWNQNQLLGLYLAKLGYQLSR